MKHPVRRWLFADQLGDHFLADPDQPVLLVESTRVLARRRFHRQKAHLVLSALRHRAAELGEQARYVRVDRYADALDGSPLEVAEPTSFAAERFVAARADLTVVRSPAYACHRDEFARWASGRQRAGKRLLMEDFYRDQRRRFGVLLEGNQPTGGRWNLDHDNRQPPPRAAKTLGQPAPWWPVEDEIDEQVRSDLDGLEASGTAHFAGRDGPRLFAVTRGEALVALDHFVATRLAAFGPHEDAMLAADWTMAHSLLSVPLNLGLLHPLEVAAAAEDAYHRGDAPSPASKASSVRCSAGGSTSGASTGTPARPTGTATRSATTAHCRRGSMTSMPKRSPLIACPRCWPRFATAVGCITSLD